MTQKELVDQFCEFRGKLTTDDVVALNFAYKTLVPQGTGRMTKEEFIMAVEDWYLTGNEDSITFLGRLYDEVTQPQWISVGDELPKDKELVFITDGEYTDTGFYEYTFDEWQPCEKWLGDITHWMPLPSLPSSSVFPKNCEKGGEG